MKLFNREPKPEQEKLLKAVDAIDEILKEFTVPQAIAILEGTKLRYIGVIVR